MPKPALPTLIKLVQQELEHLQQALAHNQQAQASATLKHQQWQAELEQAYQSAAAGTEAQGFMAASLFQARATSAMQAIMAELDTLRQQHQSLLLQLQQTFAKQKKYELLAARAALTAKRAKERAMQAQLDDMRRPAKA